MNDGEWGIPEGQLFAQLESLWAVKVYPPYRNCVRLIGVDRSAFENSSYNSPWGCRTFVIDIDWRDIGPPVFWGPYGPLGRFGPFLIEPEGSLPPDLWFKVEYEVVHDFSSSYAYPAFQSADPSYIRVRNVSEVRGTPVAPVAAASSVADLPTLDEQAHCSLTAFHVGQGMCSVFHGSRTGYILDAGAGTPVRRKQYLAGLHDDGKQFVNELSPLVSGLAEAAAIVSHPDSDHWRLLDWDASVLAKLQNVFLPAGEPALAFSAPAVKPKVVGVEDHVFRLNSRNWLDVRRSKPTASDKNGECLVTAVYCEGRRGLLPGDYVYERMAGDGNRAIVSMALDRFDAVVVPHHGDEASAAQVVAPRHPLQSKAFFSAGTHTGYGHPTPVSVASHRRRDFVVIDDHLCRDVLGKRLLP